MHHRHHGWGGRSSRIFFRGSFPSRPELLERLPELTGEARVEMGNLYRLLRGLEEEGLVTSEWDDTSPGPAKRRYAITPAGERLLDHWVEAFGIELQTIYGEGDAVEHAQLRLGDGRLMAGTSRVADITITAPGASNGPQVIHITAQAEGAPPHWIYLPQNWR